MSKIFITGDTHGSLQIGRVLSKGWPEGKKLTRDDYLIITGDFGILWNNKKEQEYWIEVLSERKYTLLFVDGNHEDHNQLQNLSLLEKFGGKVGKVSNNIFHLKRGEIYTIHNKTFFCFGGAKSRDRHCRQLNVSYWEEEVPNSKEMYTAVDNLKKYDNKVDYIITHTAPTHLIESIGMLDDYIDPCTKFLEFISKEVEYTRWYNGHLHMDKDIGNHTILWDRIVQII